MRIISTIEISEKIENLKTKTEHLEDRNSELLEEKTKLKKSLKRVNNIQMVLSPNIILTVSPGKMGNPFRKKNILYK